MLEFGSLLHKHSAKKDNVLKTCRYTLLVDVYVSFVDPLWFH